MNPIVKRTVAALVTAAVVVTALLKLPFAAVKPALIALILLAQLEFAQMVARKHPILVWQGIAAGAAFLCSKFYGYDGCFALLFFALALATLFGKTDRPTVALGTTVLGFVYLPMTLQYLIVIPQHYGMTALLYVIALVKVSDMGGFAFGKAFGRHKLCPSISPNKSWEGLAGSLFASSLVSCLFRPVTHLAFPQAILFGVLAAAVGTLGDLVESRFKRECGVKDSATFMPAGMGGFLDMFDSLVFAPAMMYPLLRLATWGAD